MELSHARGARPGAQPATRPQPGLPAPDDRRALRVLVVDDDVDTRDALELILCPEEGFEMVGCGSADACLDHLRAATHGAAPPFDVLLLDLMLPGNRVGTEILDVCSSADADAPRLPPVVVCTALAETLLATYQPRLDQYGARVIRKPFSIEVLLAELRAAAEA